MIIRVRPFNSPVIGVPLGRIMSTVRESYSASTSTTPAKGVPPSSVDDPRPTIPTIPLTLASRVAQPPASTNLAGTSGGVVTTIPSVPFVPTLFAHTA